MDKKIIITILTIILTLSVFLKTSSAKIQTCPGAVPSIEAQSYIDSFVKKLSDEEKERVFCRYYNSYAYDFTIPVPDEYTDKLPKGAPSSYQFKSPIESCYGKKAKFFCEKMPAWAQDSQSMYKDPLTMKLFEFYIIRGTKRSPYINTKDYLRSLGLLVDSLYNDIFGEEREAEAIKLNTTTKGSPWKLFKGKLIGKTKHDIK